MFRCHNSESKRQYATNHRNLKSMHERQNDILSKLYIIYAHWYNKSLPKISAVYLKYLPRKLIIKFKKLVTLPSYPQSDHQSWVHQTGLYGRQLRLDTGSSCGP